MNEAEIGKRIIGNIVEEKIRQAMADANSQFDSFAERIGVEPVKLRRFAKPYILEAIEKHFG